MIDNSNSMKPKQEKLKQRLPQLVQALSRFSGEGRPASYHIGVVTSDLGASSACAGSDDGKLNTMDRSDPMAFKSCGLGDGLDFIEYDQLDGRDNLAGRTLEEMFACIASVGVKGCGFEHSLESVRRALLERNAGFLRDDALLAIVFLTDEDDCSGPPGSPLFELGYNGIDFSKPNNFGPLNSFRCAQFGLSCGAQSLPFAAAGPFDDCRALTDTEGAGVGLLFPIDRYVDLFTRPGALKPDPERDLVVMAITAPTGPVRTLLSNPQTMGGAYPPCDRYDGVTCTPVLDRACIADDDPKFSGDPAVRLHEVVRRAANFDDATSICAPSYARAIDRLSEMIEDHIGTSCLAQAIADPNHPDCVVEELAGSTRRVLPACAAGATPCWRLDTVESCPEVVSPISGMTEKLAIAVVRGAEGVPPDSEVRAACTTLAQPR